MPGGNLAGPAQMVEHKTYPLYTPAELVDLGNQFHQQPRDPLAAWLLHLWELGVDSIMCTDNEMEKLASIMTQPSLCQPLQNSLRLGRDRFLCWSGLWL